MIGNSLVTLRKKLGYSQQEVADLIEVSRQTISNWECDQGAPTIDKAKQLAELYHVSLDDLVGKEIEFITQEETTISPLLLNLIGKESRIFFASKTVDLNNDFDHMRILDITQDWVKVEYKRTKDNSLIKKENVIQYLELSSINGFQFVKEQS